MKKSDLSRHQPRVDRLIRERVHDPYKTRLKLKDPAVCRQCGAVYEGDRWHWGEAPEGAEEALCQACHRINDKYPAGEVTLAGGFLRRHKPEILGLIHNTEAAEKEEHPLHRIMGIDERPEEIVVTTTDIHLPRRIGQAMSDAYEGEFDFDYDEDGYFIRVSWSRAD